MIIKGHIGRAPEKKLSGTTGKPYYLLRVAENYGRENDRTAVWFDVVAAIPALEADMLAVGQVVSVDGRLEPQAYVKKRALIGEPVPTTWEGVIKALQNKGALAVGLKVFTQSVKPDRFERKAPAQKQESETASQAEAEAASSAKDSSMSLSAKPTEPPQPAASVSEAVSVPAVASAPF